MALTGATFGITLQLSWAVLVLFGAEILILIVEFAKVVTDSCGRIVDSPMKQVRCVAVCALTTSLYDILKQLDVIRDY
jgi:hypothetical protein